MQSPEYHMLRMVEDRHWWHSVLRGLVMDVFSDRLPPRGYVLDAGCGTGGMLALLREKKPCLDTEGVDASGLAVQHCRQRGLAQVRLGTVHDLPFEAGVFDAVISLDVLYHADVNEHEALAEMSRVLRPGGLLVANLPAFECLRGAHDVAVCGARRYTKDEVRHLLEQHGLCCELSHYWNAWLFPPLLLWRRLSRRTSEKRGELTSDLAMPPAWFNHLLSAGGKVDAQLCRVLHIPFGSSVFAVARKAKEQQPGGGAA
ncbi:MAG: class I SAM-dependent methyltransferase [Prosthecobacter sp.]